MNLADRINQPGFNWNDFYPASRQIASPGGKVIGFPALIDNLSVIYNKKLFAAAGIPAPSPDWTWDDFRNVAKQLTDPAKHIYGVNYPPAVARSTRRGGSSPGSGSAAGRSSHRTTSRRCSTRRQVWTT